MTTSRILVVEDEPIIALDLREQLLGLGYDVPDPVASGKHALGAIEATPPDLVLMDINLNGELDGIDTVSRIPSSRRIPIIYLTSHADDAMIARAGATNPQGYLLKPFSARELNAMIQVVLARCRAEHASQAALETRRQAEKMHALRQLADNIADDFNGLLSTMYDQLDALSDHASEIPALARPIQEAYSETIEKEQLVQRLLAFSGRQKLMPEHVRVASVVAKVIDEVRDEPGTAARVECALPDDLWSIHIDAHQFESALRNLVSNAREATHAGGQLTMTASNVVLHQESVDAGSEVAPGCYILIAIADTGEGMARDVVERVFEPFFTTRRGGRDGLGLSLVFGFIRQSGGHISIDSEPRRGTTVRLWLPAVPRDENANASPVAEEPAGGDDTDPIPPPGRPEILAVDWQKSENALFASLRTSKVHRLIVEQLPTRNAWDWSVWRPGDNEESPRHGRASSVAAAMAAAEAAARRWNETSPL